MRWMEGAAIEVHRTLGPGLLESAYETCLLFELHEAGLGVLLPIYATTPFRAEIREPPPVQM